MKIHFHIFSSSVTWLQFTIFDESYFLLLHEIKLCPAMPWWIGNLSVSYFYLTQPYTTFRILCQIKSIYYKLFPPPPSAMLPYSDCQARTLNDHAGTNGLRLQMVQTRAKRFDLGAERWTVWKERFDVEMEHFLSRWNGLNKIVIWFRVCDICREWYLI